MTKRTLAAATLAALPLATGMLRADSVGLADTAAARGVTEHDARPQWTYILGERLQLIACPMGGWRCVLYML